MLIELVLCLACQKAVIDGPKSASLGDLVILDGSKSQGAGHSWALVGSNKTFLPVDQGTKVVFASGQVGKFTFVLAVAKADKADMAVHVVEITSPAPGPTPPPDPPAPGPTPPKPSDLTKKVAQWAAACRSPTRAHDATALAQNFRQAAKIAMDGGYSSVAEMLSDTTARNRRAIPSQMEAWKEAFFAPLATELEQRSPKSPRECVPIWEQIAEGLEAVP